MEIGKLVMKNYQMQSISGGESGVDIAVDRSESNHFHFR